MAQSREYFSKEGKEFQQTKSEILKQLTAENLRLDNERKFIIKVIKLYEVDNKWNWGADDIVGIIKRTLITDEDIEQALKNTK